MASTDTTSDTTTSKPTARSVTPLIDVASTTDASAMPDLEAPAVPKPEAKYGATNGSDSSVATPDPDDPDITTRPSGVLLIGPKDRDDHTHGRFVGVLGIGIMFGFALQKAAVFRADVIRGQMLWTNNTMLQTFLTAAGTSTLVMAIMHYTSLKEKVELAGASYNVCVQGVLSTVLGAFLLGSGMTVSGACPGTVYAQLGSGSLPTLYTVGGSIVGASVYGFLEPHLTKFKAKGTLPVGKRSLFELLNTNRLVTAAGMAAAFYGIAAASTLLPETLTLEPVPVSKNPLTMLRWSPFIAGPLIGLLQVPLTAIAIRNLGCSTTFMVLASHIPGFHHATKGRAAFDNHRKGWGSWWQVLMVAGVAAGAFLSASLTNAEFGSAAHSYYYKSPEPVTHLASFLGGILISFGARLANGCTSGHGISGCGHQGLTSYLGVGAMFAGGIANAFLWYN